MHHANYRWRRTHWLTRFASNLHAELHDLCDAFGTVLVDTFHYLALFALGATTVWSAIAAFLGMVHRGRAELGDLLLLFIYLEIGASRESCRANQFLQGGASHCALKSVILRVYCG